MRAEFLQIGSALSFAAALVGHHREHVLAPEVKFLELAEYRARIGSPPARTRDHYVVVFAYIMQICLEFRARIISLLLLRHLGTLNIVGRIFLHGLDLKEVGSYRVTDVLCYELRVPLLEFNYISVNIILSPAGKKDHKILCHFLLLFSFSS